MLIKNILLLDFSAVDNIPITGLCFKVYYDRKFYFDYRKKEFFDETMRSID
jgi:hypothetical protein